LSSILRALKKLETEPGHTGDKQHLDTQFVPLADVSRQKTALPIFKLAIGGGIVCGLVILAGWQLFSRKSEPLEVPVPEVSQQSIQATERNTGIPEQAVTPIESSAVAEPEEGTAEPIISEKAAVEVPGETAMEPPYASPPAAAQDKTSIADEQQAADTFVRLDEISEPELPRPKVADNIPAEEVVRTAQAAPDITYPAKEIEIPVLNDPEMKLQAITWSKDPQKRIAVINNRILRQGDTVAGYRIATINQDDIILNDRGDKWKLLFRIR